MTNFIDFTLSFQVYVESMITAPCIQVEPGDRLGVYLAEDPGAISYVFDATTAPILLIHKTEGGNPPPNVSQTIEFDSLTFPYHFSVSAFFDTGKPLNRGGA